MKKKVSVTLSAFLLSVLSGNTPHAQAADRGLRRHAPAPNFRAYAGRRGAAAVQDLPQILSNDRDRASGQRL